jgi:molecular chaperone DnaK (HSP70)
MTKAKYIIGIDLGTTNCTMAYTSLAEGLPIISQFDISQVTAPGSQKSFLSLPSFIYFPLQEELKSKTVGVEWNPSRPFCVGLFAKERGEEIPSRLISSAKSWLCHSGIDRREKILPSEIDDVSMKMSPLEACSEILKHLKEAWENKMPKIPLGKQQVLITVPASFDPSARQLVQEAANQAGYPDIILLEEPQAAFYAWLQSQEKNWRKLLKVGDCILVVDIGGGTTDFSLISVIDENGDLGLKRIAVGSHLLLGGDNLDLSLAYLAKSKFEEQGRTIDDFQFQSLVHACRKAKETLLSDDPPQDYDVAIMGRGSKLIGNTLKTSISQAEVQKLILEGFLPLLSPEERSLTERSSGILQVGLPYARDARMTCQLAKFLSMTGEADNSSMENFMMPTAVLFNGGTMKAPALRDRFITLLNQWAKILQKDSVQVLPDADYDFAVSKGAVYYGLSRLGQAIRIRGGTSRSYYIGVEDAVPAVPGIPTPFKAVCVAPFGMEEGSELELFNQEFVLVVGQPTTFRFFSHSAETFSNGIIPTIGTIVKNWKQELSELHPVETKLEKSDDDSKMIRVKLKSRMTELGVLELWCVSMDDRKWKLEFDIRHEL